MAQRFNFGNACFHFAQTDGPRGFIWKYLACYALGAVLMTVMGYLLFRPLFNVWIDLFLEMIEGASDAEIEAILVRRLTEVIGYAILGYGVMILLGLAYWAMFEAAVQRRYVRDEGFKLRLGGDEFRLMLVGLIWFFFSGALYLMSMIAVGVTTASLMYALENPVVGMVAFFLVLLGVGFFGLWLVVRLAPAAAMTIRDGRVSFFNAWGATRGRFWTLFSAYIVLAIGIWVTSAIVWPLVGTGIGAAIWANIERFQQAADNPAMLFAAIFQFDILGPVLTGWIAVLLMQGFFALIWAGPAALAAKTDPRGGGVAQAPDAFA